MLNESDIPAFKTWLKSHLAAGVVSVEFTKKNGENRVMKCTTNTDIVPPKVVVESSDPPKTRKESLEALAVYDIDKKEWRRFRWDAVKTVSIEVGQEA